LKGRKKSKESSIHSDSPNNPKISKKELIEQFFSIKELLKTKGITPDELLRIEKQRKELVPVNIFNNNKLSALESIVKYLKENINLSNKEIARLLNRDSRTIWSTNHNAAKKLPEQFILQESEIHIPLSLLRERKLSVLETIVVHLKEEYGLTHHNIAVLLRRNDRTVWTVYNRAKKKHETHR